MKARLRLHTHITLTHRIHAALTLITCDNLSSVLPVVAAAVSDPRPTSFPALLTEGHFPHSGPIYFLCDHTEKC